jgi:hypothetical protein
MSASTESANTETASVTVKSEPIAATIIANPDEDHHTVDLSSTDEQIVELIRKDHEACRKHSRSGGMFFSLVSIYDLILLIKYLKVCLCPTSKERQNTCSCPIPIRAKMS